MFGKISHWTLLSHCRLEYSSKFWQIIIAFIKKEFNASPVNVKSTANYERKRVGENKRKRETSIKHKTATTLTIMKLTMKERRLLRTTLTQRSTTTHGIPFEFGCINFRCFVYSIDECTAMDRSRCRRAKHRFGCPSVRLEAVSYQIFEKKVDSNPTSRLPSNRQTKWMQVAQNPNRHRNGRENGTAIRDVIQNAKSIFTSPDNKSTRRKRHPQARHPTRRKPSNTIFQSDSRIGRNNLIFMIEP